MRVGGERTGELTRAKRRRQVVDQRGGRGEERVEAVLDRAVGNRDSQYIFPRPGFPVKMSDRPSVTKSGARADPSSCRRGWS